jgi:homoserine O-acetyltransferase
MADYEVFELGDVVLQSAATLRRANLAYKTFGSLNARKDNVIVYPTWYSAQHYENEWLIGDGMALDPSRYFIIIPNMLGNGLSTSPSNAPPPYDRGRFPHVTLYDNVRQQHRLLTEKFGIDTVALVVGWSMGASRPINGVRFIPTWLRALHPSVARRRPRGIISYFSKG